MFLYSYVVLKENGLLEFRQHGGLLLKNAIEKAESGLDENEVIVNESKRWIDPKKECIQFIISYVDTVGIARTFIIVHTNYTDALIVFDELIWHDVDHRIGVTIKVGA